LMLAITLTLTAIGWAFSRSIAGLLHISVLDLRLLLISVPFIIASAFLEDLLIARGDIWWGSLYASGFNVFRAFSIVAAAWWTRSVESCFCLSLLLPPIITAPIAKARASLAILWWLWML